MVYCIEDDRDIRELMLYTLRTAGYEAEGYTSGSELDAAMVDRLPSLILLDIMLPGEDGISILKRLRKDPKTADLPIIMATAKGTEFDKVSGLDLGADDYLAKPFGMMEMVSRVRAVLRRSRDAKPDERLTYAGVSMNIDAHTVEVCGEPVQMTLKEFDLLHLFLKNPGRVFSRNQLLDQVWGVAFVGESRTVDVHIGTLRSKIEKAAAAIETVRGIGYKMTKEEAAE